MRKYRKKDKGKHRKKETKMVYVMHEASKSTRETKLKG